MRFNAEDFGVFVDLDETLMELYREEMAYIYERDAQKRRGGADEDDDY